MEKSKAKKIAIDNLCVEALKKDKDFLRDMEPGEVRVILLNNAVIALTMIGEVEEPGRVELEVENAHFVRLDGEWLGEGGRYP